MKLLIVHDADGNILSTAKVEPAGKHGAPSFAVGVTPGTDESVLELDLAGDLANKPLGEIHTDYRVDRKTHQLVYRKR